MFKWFNYVWMIIFLTFFFSLAKPVSANVLFRTGDIVDARNVTAGESGWSKTVKAKNLDEIEFRVFVENIGDTKSPDVRVRIGFALDPGNTLTNRIHLGVWSAPEATGTVDIQVDDDTAQKLVYVPGKSVKYGGGCDGCAVSDNIATAYGAYVGAVNPQEKVEVRFRAQVTNRQVNRVLGAATTPTPTPTTKPNTGNTTSNSSSGGTGGAAVAGTTPKTGFTDPIWMRTLVWLVIGSAGVGFRQVARKLSTIEA